MSDLPDNYDPVDDISAIDGELTNRYVPLDPVVLSFQRLQFYILELQRVDREREKRDARLKKASSDIITILDTARAKLDRWVIKGATESKT